MNGDARSTNRLNKPEKLFILGFFPNELAAYLSDKGEQPVKVVFEVTSDYGKVRGFLETEIAGLHEWESEWRYSGSSGSPRKSPWE